MAKRTEEKPFRPLEASLVQEVMSGNAAPALQPTPPPQPEKTIELRRPAEVRPEPQPQPAVDPGQGRPAPVAAPVYRQEVPRAAAAPAAILSGTGLANSVATEAASAQGTDYRTRSSGFPPNIPNAISITAPIVMPQSARLKTG